MVRNFLLSLIAIVGGGVLLASAQSKQVTGTVANTDNRPIAGATVLVEGTTVGTTTDANGRFSISAPADGTLKISFIGYQTQTVSIAGKTQINVSLQEDTHAIDDVIVVAYGTAKKESFTGSVSAVSGEELKKLQVSNVSKALEGLVPGVQVASQTGQPGSSSTISIRGIGSINAGSDPLYIVDGAPYNGSIAAINPADIESISVSKDAVSTALYGSRAANGLVIITTKKGNATRTNVQFDARVGVNSRGVGNYDIMTSPDQYLKTFYQYLVNTEGDGATAASVILNRLGYNPYISATPDKLMTEDGELISTQRRYTDDWSDEALHAGLRQEYNVSISGGNNKLKHFMSLGYLNDEGIIKNSDYSRYSGRANASYQVNKWVDLYGNLAYSHGEQNAQMISSLANYNNTFMFIQSIAPIYPVYAYDKDGNLIRDENGGRIYDFGDGTYGTRSWGKGQNIVATDKANKNETLTDQISARAGINLNILSGLKFSANLSYDLTNQQNVSFMTPSYGDAKTYNGTGTRYTLRDQTLTGNQLLTYEKTIGNHAFSVMAGHESYKWEYRYFTGSKRNFYDPENSEFNNAISMQDISSYTYDESIESWFGSIHYEYGNRYYLDANIRGDGSSRFAKENRWGIFWSVGANWRLSQESFLKDVEWINNLALKVSYGTTGNNQIPNYYPYKDQYSVSPNGDEFSVTQVYWGNPDLTWEVSNNLNAGINASLFDARFNLNAEYFHKKTSDMLYDMPFSPSTGIPSKPMNIMTMINKGFEFTLSAVPLRTKNTSLEVILTGTTYTNSVTDLPADKLETGITHLSYYNIKDGGSVWDFYGLKSAGVDPETGDALYWHRETGENGEETLTKVTYENVDAVGDKFYLGTAIPDFIGGITVNFNWKGLDFSIAGNYQIGGKVYDAMYNGLMHAGTSDGANWHKDILNAWTPENTNTNVPKLNGSINQTQALDPYMISASYFNLRNITLGYTLPQKWAKAIKMSSVRIYVAADNVALLSKRKGLDPRQYIQGQSQANYSVLRTVSGGVTINF